MLESICCKIEVSVLNHYHGFAKTLERYTINKINR